MWGVFSTGDRGVIQYVPARMLRYINLVEPSYKNERLMLIRIYLEIRRARQERNSNDGPKNKREARAQTGGR
jgi:hypothetical protein